MQRPRRFFIRTGEKASAGDQAGTGSRATPARKPLPRGLAVAGQRVPDTEKTHTKAQRHEGTKVFYKDWRESLCRRPSGHWFAGCPSAKAPAGDQAAAGQRATLTRKPLPGNLAGTGSRAVPARKPLPGNLAAAGQRLGGLLKAAYLWYIGAMKKEKPVFAVKLPSFLKGFVSAFDITGQTLLDIPDFNTGFQRDAQALRGDWQKVGGDLRKAMDSFAGK